LSHPAPQGLGDLDLDAVPIEDGLVLSIQMDLLDEVRQIGAHELPNAVVLGPRPDGQPIDLVRQQVPNRPQREVQIGVQQRGRQSPLALISNRLPETLQKLHVHPELVFARPFAHRADDVAGTGLTQPHHHLLSRARSASSPMRREIPMWFTVGM
jgi:hypothetical protein